MMDVLCCSWLDCSQEGLVQGSQGIASHTKMQYQPIGGARPAPAQVILRIKRRREEPPVEMVVVEAASQSKKAKGADGLAARLASLSTSAAPNQTGQAGAAQG